MENIKSLLEEILFDNDINEALRPDHFNKKFSSSAINDRTASEVDGKNNYADSFSKDKLPIASSQVMPDHITTSKLDINNLLSDNYSGPKTMIELSRAINSMILDLELNQEQIDSVWNKNLKLFKSLRG